MPIQGPNPLIPLSIRPPDIAENFNAGAQTGMELGLTPYHNALLEAQTQGAQVQNQAASQEQKIAAGAFLHNAATAILAAPEAQRGQVLAGVKQQMSSLGYDKLIGIDLNSVDPTTEELQTLAQQTAAFAVASGKGQNTGLRGTPIPYTGEDGKTYMGGVVQGEDGSLSFKGVPVPGQLTDRTGLTPEVAAMLKIATSGGQRGAELDAELNRSGQLAAAAAEQADAVKTAEELARLNLSPQVESAITAAVEAAKGDAKIAQEDRSNARAFATYSKTMTSLVNSMSDTSTGPLAGWIPAISANQQIADGAVAVMRPVLKSIFRQSGEGNWTDADQAGLDAMLPTRLDKPEARTAKIVNIDRVIRAKLGMSDEDIKILIAGDQKAYDSLPSGAKYIVNGYIYTKGNK